MNRSYGFVDQAVIHLRVCFVSAVNPMITTHPMSLLRESSQDVILDCRAVAFPPPSYNWSTPSNSINFMISSIMFIASYNNFGNYTCTASSNGVMVTSDTAVLTGDNVVYWLHIKYIDCCLLKNHVNV